MSGEDLSTIVKNLETQRKAIEDDLACLRLKFELMSFSQEDNEVAVRGSTARAISPFTKPIYFWNFGLVIYKTNLFLEFWSCDL